MANHIHRFRPLLIPLRLMIAALFLLTGCGRSQAQELRATWIARDQLTNRETIARAMDSLAANNFNTVIVNVWSRGYPLFPSDRFFERTGISIDPNYAGRDILQEAIAEGHRAGLHVEAWFEYGFVGGYSGYLPGTSGKGRIFDSHPEWVARQQNGTEIDGSGFYWMTHTRPDAQDLLIGMAMEVARRYDVDGIEMDRIRYSSLNYGYDAYTDSLYRAEHTGQAPPAPSDTSWKRWRADKLNAFVARLYDSVKAVNPHITVSNAPSMYSSSAYSSYDSFCQDWVWWVNQNKVDNVLVQSYVASPSTFSSYIDNMKARITDDSRIHPSFAVKPNGTFIGAGTATSLISVVRGKALAGSGIWYSTDLTAVFPELKAGPYAAAAHPPHFPAQWRSFRTIVPIADTMKALRSGVWTSSANPGYAGPSLFASSSGSAVIQYSATVPVSGMYEVYAFAVTSANRTTAAPYTVHASTGQAAVTVDQSKSINAGWRKLGDFHFTQGAQHVVTLSNQGIGDGKLVSADAVMLVLNRRLSPMASPVTSVVLQKHAAGQIGQLLQNFPNPFNPVTTVRYVVGGSAAGEAGERVVLSIFDPLGREVTRLVDAFQQPGTYSVRFNAAHLSAGVYFARLTSSGNTVVRKINLLK
ncbi:MAG: family 10 glycosylhydrolase [Bacteroidetes bacterium]|nr:family 10 glycosylhydrolase [Bacteroidota bacterium]